MAAAADSSASAPDDGNVRISGYLIKSPRNADERDPDKPTGMLKPWRRRFFRLCVALDGPRVLEYLRKEGAAEVRDSIALNPGTQVEESSSPKRRYLLHVTTPVSYNKDKKKIKEARHIWLDCENEENHKKWFEELSQTGLINVAAARVQQVSAQFFSSSFTPFNIKLEASRGGGSMVLKTIPNAGQVAIVSRIPLFGRCAFHGDEASKSQNGQVFTSVSCPKKIKHTEFLGPASTSTDDMPVNTSMRLLVQVEGGESLQLVAYCASTARLLCHAINACDLSNTRTAITNVLALLACSVSLETSMREHPEHNFLVNLQVFREWILSTLSRTYPAALACSDETAPLLIQLIHSLANPKTSYCDLASGQFVIDVIDILIQHTRKTPDEDTERIALCLETMIFPAIAQVLSEVARQPAFVRGVLQDFGPDWKTSNIHELQPADIPKAMEKELADLNRVFGTKSVHPPLEVVRSDALVVRSVDRNAMLLHHVDAREPRILQRLLYLLLAISNDENSYVWMFRQAAATAQLATVLKSLAQYRPINDPHLINNAALRDRRITHIQRTLGALVPTLLVVFDNLAAFISDPDRPAPDEASVRLWVDTITPAVSTLLQCTATIDYTSILLQFCDPARLSSSLPKSADLASMRRDVNAAIYPLRRRGGFLWGTDHGANFSALADLFYLSLDHIHHVRTKLSRRILAVNTEESRRSYEWLNAHYPENSGNDRTWTVANGRVYALNEGLQASSLVAVDISIEMSAGGGTLVLFEAGTNKGFQRIALYGASASHANDPNQAWVSSDCPKKVDDPRWLGGGAQSAFHITNSMRLIVQRPDGSSIQFVAHCDWHARLLCKLINACDLSDNVDAARRVLDLLVFLVKDFSFCPHYEHNSQILVKSLRDWLLFTLERHMEVTTSLCNPQPGQPTICDLISAVGQFKTLYRDQAFGMFVIELVDILIRSGRNRREEAAKIQPIARYVETYIIPAIVTQLALASEKPAFVRGVVQDSGADWHSANLFDGRSIPATIKSESKWAQDIMETRSLLSTLDEIGSFAKQRLNLLGAEGRHLLFTAHPDSKNPRVLLRLVYLLVNISSDEASAPWLYRQSSAVEQIAQVLKTLAQFELDSEPHLTQNRDLYEMRASHVQRTFGGVVPALFVFFDNLAVVEDGAKPAEKDIKLWETLFPHISAALLATTTTEPSSLIFQFLPAQSGGQLSLVCSEICTVLLSLRRRGDVLCDESFSGKDVLAFKQCANVCMLAYDHLYHIVRKLSGFSPALRAAAVTQLMVLCDAVLTRITKTEKDPVGQLLLLREPRFSHLDYIFMRVVEQFPDTHLSMLTGEGGSRLGHTLEALSFHFRDLAFSATAKDGIYSIVLFFRGVAALVPGHNSTAAVDAALNALQQHVLPHIIKLGVACFTRDHIYFLHMCLSNPEPKLRNNIPKHTMIAESLFVVLGNLLRLPAVAAVACETHGESIKRLLQAMVLIDDLDDLAQVPLAVAVCNALISLEQVVAVERAMTSGVRGVQTAIAQSFIAEVTRVLEQLCKLDSIIIFAVARLLFVWLGDEMAAVALTRVPPTEGMPKIINYLGDPAKTALKYQDRWILRIINRLLSHSQNGTVADFLCVSVSYELMKIIKATVQAISSSDGWDTLILAMDVSRRILGYSSKAASVICDRVGEVMTTLMSTLRSQVATADELARKRMQSMKNDDAVFIASLIAALAAHVSADPTVSRIFRQCEDIESILVVALETNVEDSAMRRYLLHTLASLVLCNRGHAEQIAIVNNMSGTRIICKMLRHSDRDIQAHAAVVLSQIATHAPARIKDIGECGGFTTLIEQLGTSDQSDLCRLALMRLLVRICADQDAANALFDKDVVEMLVNFLGRFQGGSTNLRYTLYYELGILRALMKMCMHETVRRRLYDSPLRGALEKIQEELPQDLMTIEAVAHQLQGSGNEEEEGAESFLTNPQVLSELSGQMKAKLKETGSRMLDNQKQQVRIGQRRERHLSRDEMQRNSVEVFNYIQDIPNSQNSIEAQLVYLLTLLDDKLSGDEVAEMYREPMSAIVSPEEQRRFALAQVRSINQLAALLKHLPEAKNTQERYKDPSAKLRLMISYNWGHQTLAIQVAEKLGQLKDCVESVWIDTTRMNEAASIYDGMANAVQDSDALVVLPSPAYEKSTNCNLEIKYSADLKKKYFHVKVDKVYSPRGTVGLLLAGSLYVDLTEKFDTNFLELAKQVRSYHQTLLQSGGKGVEMAKPALPSSLPASEEPPPNYVEATGQRLSVGAAAAPAGRAMPGALGTPAGGMRLDSLKKFMVMIELDEYLPAFEKEGIKTVADLSHWEEAELVGIGMKRGEAKRALANAKANV